MSRCFCLIVALATIVGCEQSHTHDHDHSHHVHVAPHGGTLVVFGDEFAHVELVLDAETGSVDAYVLDGEAEKPIRLSVESLSLRAQGGLPAFDCEVNLVATANVLTGETVGDTSQFSGTAEALKGVKKFHGTLAPITILGRQFPSVEFPFPEGNEHHHHGDHEH